MTARKVKEYTDRARLYIRIIGLGCGKHAHDVAYDDVETLLQGRELKPSAATNFTAFA